MDAKARRRYNKKLRKEKAAIESATKKRGLWASVGSSLGSLLAMAVIGTGAAPLVAGLAAGGLSFFGGSLGNYLAKGSKGGKIKGGRFYQEERGSLAKGIQEQVGASAVDAAFKTALLRLGGKVNIGGAGSISGGGTATATTGGSVPSGFKFGDIFKGGDKVAGQTGLGKALDFRGSYLGGGIQALKSKAIEKTARESGWIDPNLQAPTSKFTDVFPQGGDKPIIAMDRRTYAPTIPEKSASIDKMLLERGSIGAPPTFDEIMSGPKKGPGFQVDDSPLQRGYDFPQGDLALQERLGLTSKPNLMDSLGKPSLDVPFEAPSRGVGMDHPRLPSGMKHQTEMERIMGMSETAQREAALNLMDTDFVQTPYQTEFEALDQSMSWQNRILPSTPYSGLRRSKPGTGFDPRW